MLKGIRSSLLLLVFLSACKTSSQSDMKSTSTQLSSDSKLGIGLNDVSILLPYYDLEGKSPIGLEIETLAPSIISKPDPDRFARGLSRSVLDDQPFVPQKFIDQMAKLQKEELPALPDTDLSATKLTSIRFESCANRLSANNDLSKCLAVMQLTWQTILVESQEPKSEKSIVMEDRNFHTVYVLTADELKDALSTLKSMHKSAPVDTEDFPLQPNPAILREGVKGQYFNSALGLVHRFARASKLFGFSSIATGSKRNSWNMAQAQIIKGQMVMLPVFSTETTARSQSFRAIYDFSPDENIEESVGSSSPFRLPNIGTSPASFETLSDEDKKLDLKDYITFVKNAQAIDNPEIHSATNLDCASCHRSFAASLYDEKIVEKPQDLFKHRFQSKRWNLKNLPGSNPSTKSLQMFSFNFKQPKITQRVINESAEALHIMELRELLK